MARRPATHAGRAKPPSQTALQPPGASPPRPLENPAGWLPSGDIGEETGGIANAKDAAADGKREKNGLAQLVLTLMKVLHELLKRQALRRIEGGALAPAQIERLGVTLKNQAREIDRLRKDFGLPEEGLNLDLGPLGKLL